MLRTNGFPMKHKVWAIVQQDNAPVHTSQVAMRSVWDCGLELPPYLPYSSDVVPSDYYLFHNWKKCSGPDIWWWQWVNICYGGVYHGARLRLLQSGYRCITDTIDQVFSWREIMLNNKWTKLAKLPSFLSMLEIFYMALVRNPSKNM